MADATAPKGLSFKLTDEQLMVLKPLIEATGKLKIAADITGDTLKVSFLACNAAFLACNAAFLACNAAFRACNASFVK